MQDTPSDLRRCRKINSMDQRSDLRVLFMIKEQRDPSLFPPFFAGTTAVGFFGILKGEQTVTLQRENDPMTADLCLHPRDRESRALRDGAIQYPVLCAREAGHAGQHHFATFPGKPTIQGELVPPALGSEPEGGTVADLSDYISTQLRTQAAPLLNSIGEQARSMLPMMMLSPSPEAIAAGRAKRDAIAAQQLAVVMVEWEDVRARAQNGPMAALLLALLDLHKPYTTFGSAPCCEDCMSGGFATEAEAVDWPCETYGIIRDGLA